VSDLLLAGSGLTRRYHLPRPHPLGRRAVRTALRGVGLCVPAGERVGVVGGSGAGRSTLLRLLLAVEAPDEARCGCAGGSCARSAPEGCGGSAGRCNL